MDCEARQSLCRMSFMKNLVYTVVAVAAVSFVCAQAETWKKTSCSAPSVVEGEPATVTCDFGRALDPSFTTLSVDYLGADGKQKSLVSCFPDEGNTSKCIYNADWLKLRNDTCVVNPLSVYIPLATRNHNGTYSCHLVPPSGPEIPCVLHVKERTSQPPPTQQLEYFGATSRTDVTRLTGSDLPNTTTPSPSGTEMPLTGVNVATSTEAGAIAAVAVILLAVLVIIICVTAYFKCESFRDLVRSRCLHRFCSWLKPTDDHEIVKANGAHGPSGKGGEVEAYQKEADHHEACHNGDVEKPMLLNVDDDADWAHV